MTVNEHPILFKPELVRAILDEKKTETRRIMKPQTSQDKYGWKWGRGGKHVNFSAYPDIERFKSDIIERNNSKFFMGNVVEPLCPYGKVGDELWVRETWAIIDDSELGVEPYPVYKADHLNSKYPGDWPEDEKDNEKCGRWKPSIHMPRKYCRLRLKIKDIRVERIQDITHEGILAEGVEAVLMGIPSEKTGFVDIAATRLKWIELWDSINSKRGFPWKSNPWVWCLTFEVVPID